MNRLFIIIGLCASMWAWAGKPVFQDQFRLPATEIKMQSKTNTCWAFSTLSFLESEIIRTSGDTHNLSEMFVVYHAFNHKAEKYVLSHGQSRLSDGGLARDVLWLIDQEGIVPEKSYKAKMRNGFYFHDHLLESLNAYFNPWTKKGKYKKNWREKVDLIIQEDLPKPSDQIEVENFVGSSKKYWENLNLELSNYVEFTSFTHKPYYTEFVLEVPDNWLGLRYRNIPLMDLTNMVDSALVKGYSVAWTGDFSEKNFHAKKGYAQVNNEDSLSQLALTEFVDLRQKHFETYETTDDHSMHIIGKAVDENGVEYYIAKNSWGHYGSSKGYVYLSTNYLKLKTIAILLHKRAVPSSIWNNF